MGSHNQDFWQMNYWKNNSTKEAITKASWYQDSGATNGAQSSSHWKINDFGVKCVGEEHALHLKQTLEENYKVTLEWEG